ncbi:MAG TPA: Na/Pi symporter [Candidatus Krumholzibacteria bacterium]|nr:Na/Pi symporter [Candidatus Krumholzibacteria bacterium]HPD72880.1 Na/Pi symporter [Candidatus Krumholzibacteria bacterium]HRY41679.1 Na/Pi symporter [Candidatus Krumholzibacteria bacterium]
MDTEIPRSHPTGRALAPALATCLRALQVTALLYFFLVAISLLGSAFKLFGDDFSATLITGTSHPVTGLMIGLLATALVQSSSSTTSIVVGLVAAGALTVRGAVPIIMGANLGTTVTNTIVALTSINRRSEFRRALAGATMHDFFNLLSILILFPLEMATHALERTATWLSGRLVGSQGLEFDSPVKAACKPAVDLVERALGAGLGVPDWAAGAILLALSLALIALALVGLTRVLKQAVLSRAEGSLTRWIGSGGLGAMLVGLLLTVAVQSSSITTSLLVPLIGAGLVSLESGFAVTLGANLGTTITALMASLAGNGAAVAIALVHLLFNVFGILAIYPLRSVRRIPIVLARNLAFRSSRNKIWVVLYMVGVFFALPVLFVLVDRAVH